jgi:hypothetical protein
VQKKFILERQPIKQEHNKGESHQASLQKFLEISNDVTVTINRQSIEEDEK